MRDRGEEYSRQGRRIWGNSNVTGKNWGGMNGSTAEQDRKGR
jgi:hypothetical protein